MLERPPDARASVSSGAAVSAMNEGVRVAYLGAAAGLKMAYGIDVVPSDGRSQPAEFPENREFIREFSRIYQVNGEKLKQLSGL
jgi:hypothetical protein